MKFINYLKTIEGVGIYPLVSLIIFFAFFVLLLVYVAKADKKTMEELEHLPFDNSLN
ncbi:MAG: CcoQ/FixQ family Cbb3-type cytochrome c oxidase assembly chaperone [Chitinophagaceae bacterium]|nr:CcoQ/FixQ family Cbb3-type cytochrome c oxidase assembly chaperone [Chitinophagaceae bacterium]